MWNDNETIIDLIDYSYLTQAVLSIVENDSLLPCTIGVFGDWGSGKSSLMRMIEESLTDPNTLCVKFNGWLFEGYDDAKSVLLTNIIEAIVKNRTLEEKAKHLAKKLLKSIDWLKIAKTATAHGVALLTTGGIGNIALGLRDIIAFDETGGNPIIKAFEDGNYDETLKKISSKDKEPQMGIKDFHENLGNLLTETKIKHLLIFIDDLDRCNPDTVIATLEAIKLFLFAPHTAFIIGADESLIRYSVRKKYSEIAGEAEISRNYLEKLIQIPLRIPPMSDSEVEVYINLLFAQKYFPVEEFEKIRDAVIKAKVKEPLSSIFNVETVKSYIDGDIPKDLSEDLLLSRQITPILSSGLNGNPRQCKRFLNALFLRLRIAENKKVDLKKRILAKLMLLEYFKPESFRLLFNWQASQNGIPKELAILEESDKLTTSQKPSKKELNLETWSEDQWLQSWLKIEPHLATENLSPYFYFSRDILSFKIGISLSRMSTSAQDALKNLISKSKSEAKMGIEALKVLSLSDVSAIFQELSNMVYIEETIQERVRIQKILIDLADNIEGIRTETITFFNNLPVNLISPGIVPKLAQCYQKKKDENQMISLFNKWSENSDTSLAKAAKRYLNKQN
jgi:predicted KAP-like P-loop ATPase